MVVFELGFERVESSTNTSFDKAGGNKDSDERLMSVEAHENETF